MSTRCHIQFYDRALPVTEPTARIYQHSDGYPDTTEGVLWRLKKLYQRLSLKDPQLKKLPHPFDKTKTAHDYAQMYGVRIEDAEWAAAEYITMFRQPMGGNIYVTSSVHGDEAYLYRVDMTVNPWRVSVYYSAKDWVLEKEVSIPKEVEKTDKTDKTPGRKFR